MMKITSDERQKIKMVEEKMSNFPFVIFGLIHLEKTNEAHTHI